MSELRKQIFDALKEKRSNISDSSCKTYTSLLVSVYNNLDGKNGLEFFKSHSKIIPYVKSLEKAQTRKTTLSSLYVLTALDNYKESMMEDIKEVNDFYKKQKNDPERQSRVKTFEEVVAIHNAIKGKFKSKPINDNLVDLLVSYLFSGALENALPPRRLLDYSEMKLKNYNSEKDNYIEKGKMYFNNYKTKEAYGTQIIPIPKELNALINKWKKINDNDYLLVSEDGKKFTSSGLGKKIGRLFEGNSVDMLRSIFLSHYYRDMPKLTEMEDIANKMGNSINAHLNYYVKK